MTTLFNMFILNMILSFFVRYCTNCLSECDIDIVALYYITVLTIRNFIIAHDYHTILDPKIQIFIILSICYEIKTCDQGKNPNWPVSSHFHSSFSHITSTCGGLHPLHNLTQNTSSFVYVKIQRNRQLRILP